MNIEVVQTEKLSAQQEQALEELSAAVYPPNDATPPSGEPITWASPQWSFLLWEQDELVTHLGLLEREILQDGKPKRIGGLGAVATHPAKQGQGFASLALREAAKWFDTDLDVPYALLFCRPDLIPFYERLLWKRFMGQVFVDQPQGRINFTANVAMVLDVKESAPLGGFLDLNGLPW